MCLRYVEGNSNHYDGGKELYIRGIPEKRFCRVHIDKRYGLQIALFPLGGELMRKSVTNSN